MLICFSYFFKYLLIFDQLSMNGVYFPGKPRDYDLVRLAFAEDPCGIWIELHILPKGGKPTMK